MACPVLQEGNARPSITDSLANQADFLALSNISFESRSERFVTILA
jgi:hypothetical protein